MGWLLYMIMHGIRHYSFKRGIIIVYILIEILCYRSIFKAPDSFTELPLATRLALWSSVETSAPSNVFESHSSNLPVEITDYTVIKRVNTELYTDRLQHRITNNWMFFLRTRLFGSMDFVNNSLSIVSGYHLNSIHYDVYSILFLENSSIWQFISLTFYLWLTNHVQAKSESD